MTPEQKSQELIDKFKTYAVMWSGGIEVENQNAKQCAIICVDEIFKYMGDIDDESTMPVNQPNGLPYTCWHYWVTVKEEINKL